MTQPEATQPEALGLPHQKYRTVSISEVHYIGIRLRPLFHVIRQEIEALDVCRKFPFYFDDRNVTHVSGTEGCLIGNYRQVTETLSGADVHLSHELQPGERATAEIKSWWRQPDVPIARPILPECRRQIGGTAIESVTMAVNFDRIVPHSVWAAEWPDIYPGTPMSVDDQVELDVGPPPEDSVEPGSAWAVRHVENAQPGRVFGIAWEW